MMARVGAAPQADGGIELRAPGADPLSVAVPGPGRTRAVRVFSTVIEAVDAGPRAAAWWSALLGQPARMTHLDDPATRRPIPPAVNGGRTDGRVSFADGLPLLLTSTVSLAALNELIAQGDHPAEGPLPMNRFRPNVVVDGAAPWAEDRWRRVRLGEVVFRVVKPCARCVVTTTDQANGTRGKEPLLTLAKHRRFGNKLMFGQNLVPEAPGTLRVGDAFSVVE